MTNQYDQTGKPAGKPGILSPEAEDQLKEDAGAALETAKSEAGKIASEVQAQAGAVMDEAKSELGKVAAKAKGMAAEQKELVADQIDSVAQAVDKVAGELEANNAATAGYARTFADTVNTFSDNVKNKDVDELLSMAEDFGRRQPAAFMAAAALAGFAASRFLVASQRRHQQLQPTSGSYAAGTAVGDGGVSGNYRSASGMSTSPSGSGGGSSNTRRSSSTTRDTMGGGIR
jgi:hypothetical protein